jgi:hypothetical protein
MTNPPKVTEIMPGLIHLEYTTQRELAETFLRPQEYYESAKFKGKIFTLEEFRAWYVKNSADAIMAGGKFTYYEDWDAFNVPGEAFTPFFEGKFNPLSKTEENLLKILENKKDQKFYVIGTFAGGDPTNVTHEISHGLFHLNEEYKKSAIKIIKNLNAEDHAVLKNYLSNNNYNSEVFDDEIQAHLLATTHYLEKSEGIKITTGIKRASLELRVIYDRFLSLKV